MNQIVDANISTNTLVDSPFAITTEDVNKRDNNNNNNFWKIRIRIIYNHPVTQFILGK